MPLAGFCGKGSQTDPRPDKEQAGSDTGARVQEKGSEGFQALSQPHPLARQHTPSKIKLFRKRVWDV